MTRKGMRNIIPIGPINSKATMNIKNELVYFWRRNSATNKASIVRTITTVIMSLLPIWICLKIKKGAHIPTGNVQVNPARLHFSLSPFGEWCNLTILER